MTEVRDEVPEVPVWRILGIVGMLVALYIVLVAVDDSGRGRREPSASAARSAVVGLTGVGLILAQALSGSGMRWLLLGGIAFLTAGAARAWIVQSRAAEAHP